MEDGRMLTNEDFKEGLYYDESDNERYDTDYRHLFRPGDGFDTREEAMKWVQTVGYNNNMYFAITGSTKTRVYFGCERKSKYVEPVEDDERINKRKRKSRGTKKCGCNFQVKVHYKQEYKKWLVKMDPSRGVHNHKLGKYGNWHSSFTKLGPKEEKEIESLTNDNMRPQAILQSMQKKSPCLNLRQVYNTRNKLKSKEAGGLSTMALLFKRLKQKKYLYWARDEDDGSKELRDIVFAHPDALKLLRKFPNVLLMDGTYSTNRYKFPLIEIIGVCSTGKNYHIAFAFVKKEVKDNFLFVMQAVREMYSYAERVDLKDVKGPEVIVTDRELACINALVEVFPKANHFLCRRHISVDVRKYVASFAKLLYPANSEKSVMWTNSFSKRWNKLVRKGTVEAFEEYLKELEKEWAKFPKILNYIRDTWLNPYRERFVAAWTDKVKHYGNTTTNRVEGAHSQLKQWIGSSRGNFATCFKKIDELVVLQIGEIKTQFEKSLSINPHIVQYAVFRLLGGNLTHKAMDLLMEEGRTPGDCVCVLPITHGLPCKCAMAKLILANRPIELGMIDPFWRTLDMEENEKKVLLSPSAKYVAEQAWNKLMSGSPSDSTLYMASSLLHKMAVPESCDYEEPKHVKPKGRPKGSIGSRFKSFFETEELKSARVNKEVNREEGGDLNDNLENVNVVENEEIGGRGNGRGNGRGRGRGKARGTGRGNARGTGRGRRGEVTVRGRGRGRGRGKGRGQGSIFVVEFPFGKEVPSCILDFITLYINVKPDGNCGFRAIAFWHYNDENRWDDVRRDLMKELITHREFWSRLINVDFELCRLDYHEAPGTNERYWFDFLSLGQVVATAYQAAVFCFGIDNPRTFLPLRCDDSLNLEMPLKEYGVGRIVSMAHFVVLGVSSNCPIPPIFPGWKKKVTPSLHQWADGFGDRIKNFEDAECSKKTKGEPEYVVLDP